MSTHAIKNFDALATTKIRRDCLATIEAGLKAIDTRTAIRKSVRRDGRSLRVGDRKFDLAKYRNVYFVGIGKAAADSAALIERILGARLTDGIVLDVKAAKTRRIKSVVGTHPFPSGANTRATGEIIGLLKQVESGDLVITVVSGGGSALLCMPYGMKCGEIVTITKTMMRQGASIGEMNVVRKHLSEIQGGQFARLAYPATVLGIIFSDVVGDDLATVGSGPTVMDLSTVADAKRIMDKYDLRKACKLPDCELRETPKDPIYFRDVTNVLVMSNAVALAAMEKEASKRGYAVRVYSRTLEGEAREVGRLLAGLPKPGEMVLAAGETTVTVKGKGTGGRNQEVALGALLALEDGVTVVSCASDGIDNSSAAGALADKAVLERSKRLKLDPKTYLKNNDSHGFFGSTGGRIETGMTGANVSDLMLAARPKK